MLCMFLPAFSDVANFLDDLLASSQDVLGEQSHRVANTADDAGGEVPDLDSAHSPLCTKGRTNIVLGLDGDSWLEITVPGGGLPRPG